MPSSFSWTHTHTHTRGLGRKYWNFSCISKSKKGNKYCWRFLNGEAKLLVRVKWQKHKASSQCRKRVAVSGRIILKKKKTGGKKKAKGRLVQKRAMVSDGLKQMRIVESVFENNRRSIWLSQRPQSRVREKRIAEPHLQSGSKIIWAKLVS